MFSNADLLYFLRIFCTVNIYRVLDYIPISLLYPIWAIGPSLLKLNIARKEALSAIFVFYQRYPYNPYISR